MKSQNTIRKKDFWFKTEKDIYKTVKNQVAINMTNMKIAENLVNIEYDSTLGSALTLPSWNLNFNKKVWNQSGTTQNFIKLHNKISQSSTNFFHRYGIDYRVYDSSSRGSNIPVYIDDYFKTYKKQIILLQKFNDEISKTFFAFSSASKYIELSDIIPAPQIVDINKVFDDGLAKYKALFFNICKEFKYIITRLHRTKSKWSGASLIVMEHIDINAIVANVNSFLPLGISAIPSSVRKENPNILEVIESRGSKDPDITKLIASEKDRRKLHKNFVMLGKELSGDRGDYRNNYFPVHIQSDIFDHVEKNRTDILTTADDILISFNNNQYHNQGFLSLNDGTFFHPSCYYNPPFGNLSFSIVSLPNPKEMKSQYHYPDNIEIGMNDINSSKYSSMQISSKLGMQVIGVDVTFSTYPSQSSIDTNIINYNVMTLSSEECNLLACNNTSHGQSTAGIKAFHQNIEFIVNNEIAINCGEHYIAINADEIKVNGKMLTVRETQKKEISTEIGGGHDKLVHQLKQKHIKTLDKIREQLKNNRESLKYNNPWFLAVNSSMNDSEKLQENTADNSSVKYSRASDTLDPVSSI